MIVYLLSIPSYGPYSQGICSAFKGRQSGAEVPGTATTRIPHYQPIVPFPGSGLLLAGASARLSWFPFERVKVYLHVDLAAPKEGKGLYVFTVYLLIKERNQ